MNAIETAARTLLRGVAGDVDPQTRRERLLGLMPQASEYARVFLPSFAARAEAAYAELWPLLRWPIKPGETELVITSATVLELRGRDVPGFPGGYRAIAAALVPGPVWVCCEFIAPGRDAGILLDGLVCREGRWSWFPKPWKVLQVPTMTAATMSHWGE